MRPSLCRVIGAFVLVLACLQGMAAAQASANAPLASDINGSQGDVYGIAAHRPVFAGACKACPWGILASVTKEAPKSYGYDVKICWVCWSSYGPREMADKTKPVMPKSTLVDPAYIEPPPDLVPDISAISLTNLTDAWNGTGVYAPDHKQRWNFRIVAALQQPNYLIVAATKASGIAGLAEIKNRNAPTWITAEGTPASDAVLAHYGLTAEGLRAKGGGFISREASREKRAKADVFIGGGLLVNTPEHRVWYEVSQMDDLIYFDMDATLLTKLATLPDYRRAILPLAILRGVDRPIPTVMRSTHVIYVRNDAPDSFAYAVAKALDEHHDKFRLQAEPWYYDTKIVAASSVIPMHPGALQYYHERGYVQ